MLDSNLIQQYRTDVNARYSILDAGGWSLVARCWLLVGGFWKLVV